MTTSRRTAQLHGTLRIDIPDTWHEDSVTIFSNGATGEEAASVVVKRGYIDPRTTLSMYIDTQLVELAKSLPSFTLTARRDATVANEHAMQMTYTWVVQGSSYSQTQTILRDAPNSVVSIITSSASRAAAAWNKEFEAILDSLVVLNRQ
jgi:hypothetical protein